MSNTRPPYSKYLEASKTGAYTGILTTLASHPCDRIKTHMQANPMLSSTAIVKKIMEQRGVQGFYTGIVPNMMRASIKQTYRWPAQKALTPFYGNLLGDETNISYPRAKKVLTGVTIGAFESIIIVALEFFKIRLMLSNKRNPKLRDIRNQNDNPFEAKYDVFWKQMVSWPTFLWADDFTRSTIKDITGKKELSIIPLGLASIFTGIINTLATMPFDAVKTRRQKPNPELFQKGILGTFKKIVEIQSKEGVKALYAGGRWRMFEYMIHAFITVPLMEKQENKDNKNSITLK